MAKKTISVLGCGWLGLPLAQELVRRGFSVKGSTTTPAKLQELQAAGITPHLLSFPENAPKALLSHFLDSELLVFNIPPSRSSSEPSAYEQVVQQVLEAAPASLQKILFVSSTSVYPDLNRELTEQNALAAPNAGSLLLRAEYLVQQRDGTVATVVRLGGLMGGTRHPGRFLAGRKAVPNPRGPVNLIHLTDCVQLLAAIIEQEKWGFTFNACAPQHPTRQEFYTQAALQLGLEPPVFAAEETVSFKTISSAYLQRELAYQFTYPDPLRCLQSHAF